MSNNHDSQFISPVLDLLTHLHGEISAVNDGTVATYIPELGRANPDWFGICLVTANGAIYEVGDSQQPFTIQSISKPFVYGLALEDHGRAAMLQKVGVEPTGDVFNSISLDPGTGRPRNPMINAGAIATAGQIEGKNQETRFKRILEMFSTFAGRELDLDDVIYRSESETGHRNRAIGHMLRNFGILANDPAPTTELYFQQCSISVTCRDLGIMAATLANRGVNPVTGKKAIRGEYVENVLSVMSTCGMYDYAGEWLYNVGIPAKSGVAGGVLAVLPGQLGIGVFSPRLDAHGNSVRGIRVCQELSRYLDLHLFNRPAVGKFTIRLKFTGAELNSSRVRTASETAALRKSGRRIHVYQLQGNLMFATMETVVRDVLEHVDGITYLILDLKHALSINESACRLLYDLLKKFSAAGKSILFSHTHHLLLVRRYLNVKLAERFEQLYRTFDNNDVALEWCENQLLEGENISTTREQRLKPAEYALLETFTPEELSVIEPLLQSRTVHFGQKLISAGDAAREVFFLSRGIVSVLLPETKLRLATFSPGMSFGEMAFIDGAPRSADIVADTDVDCQLLAIEDFQRLGQTHPAIKIKLLERLSLDLCSKLRKANRELSVFD
ncbi:MAG TPA: glutaminase A [Verrucomicrobiae bacterium]|nr:glutaminase A [Verrucomicrobiae bacterium]